MNNRSINRRHFVKKLLEWTKMAALLCLFPSCAALRSADAREKGSPAHAQHHGLSLREIVQKRLHRGKDRFINPFIDVDFRSPWRLLRWKLFSENRFKTYYDQEKVNPVSVDWDTVKQKKGLSITFINHSSVMIKDLDKYILVDPIFFGLGWLFKDFTPLSFDTEEMPRPDHVLITHGHYDHLDKPSIASLGKDAHVITPLGYSKILDDLKIKNHTQMDWFDSFRDGQTEIMLLPCNHWTMRNPITGPNRSLWGSFLIKTANGKTLFISGDTAYFKGFRDIGMEFSIDLAIINLGAYEPRWFMATSHMNPCETVQALKDLRAAHLMIVHWGTFRLGDEPVHFPPIHIRQELKKEGLSDRLVFLNHGQTLFYDTFSVN